MPNSFLTNAMPPPIPLTQAFLKNCFVGAYLPPAFLKDGSSLSKTATLNSGVALTVTANSSMITFAPRHYSALSSTGPLSQGASWIIYIVDRVYGM